MKLTTTLNLIQECNPCASGWATLTRHLGADYDHDAPINLLTILDSNGVQDMVWALRATEQDSKVVSVKLAAAFARDVLHIFETVYSDDKRPRLAIEAAESGQATTAAATRSAANAAAAATRSAANAAAYAAATARAYTAAAAHAAASATHAAHAAGSADAARVVAHAAHAAGSADATVCRRQFEIILSMLTS